MQSFESKGSSNVGWARYDEAKHLLEVDFKNGAGVKTSTYLYADFPPELWERFQAAESKGRFFAYEIRPKFKGVKK